MAMNTYDPSAMVQGANTWRGGEVGNVPGGPGMGGYGGGYGDINPEGAAADPFGYTEGSLLTPWQGRFTSSGYGGGYNVPAFNPFNYADFAYNAPDPGRFTENYADPAAFRFADFAGPDQFKAPTKEEMQQDPGYQARVDAAQRAATAAGSTPADLRRDSPRRSAIRRRRSTATSTTVARRSGNATGVVRRTSTASIRATRRRRLTRTSRTGCRRIKRAGRTGGVTPTSRSSRDSSATRSRRVRGTGTWRSRGRATRTSVPTTNRWRRPARRTRTSSTSATSPTTTAHATSSGRIRTGSRRCSIVRRPADSRRRISTAVS